MKTLLFILIPVLSFAQIVKGKDISKETDFFELYAFKKPLSQKECFFIDYGQEKFRPHYYDHKTQAVYNDSGEKFEKGSYIPLIKYLKEKGWKKVDERESLDWRTKRQDNSL